VTEQSKIKILALEGSPRERGRQRGTALKSLIWERLERLKYGAIVSSLGMDPDALIERFMRETAHVAAAEKWTPHLLEEVRGIGEGAGIGFEPAFLLSSTDEMLRYAQSLQGQQTQCTSLGCWRAGDTPALLGQNLDTSMHSRNTEVLLHITEPDGRQQLVVATAGSLGAMGLSDAPLGVCVNTINLKSARDGLPLQFIVRGMLDQPTLDDAVAFLKSVKVGAAQNYMIGDAERVADYEASANQVVQFVPYQGARRVYHSNHHLANNDIIPGYPTISQNSIDRINYLKFRLDDPAKPVTLENIKGILRSHLGPICYHGEHGPNGINTWVSVVYVLAKRPELHIAVGNPCETDYQKFTFENSA